MHPNHLKKIIQRTVKQIKKQKNKFTYSRDTNDKIAAADELKRLRKKLANLQDESNKIQREQLHSLYFKTTIIENNI